MRYIHSIAVLTVGENIKPMQEYLAMGYYLHKIIYKPDREDCSVVIVNIDRESIKTVSRMFSTTYIIYGSNHDDILNLVGEYGLGEWIATIESYLSDRFDIDRGCRLIRESINATPFRRYICRGMLYGSIKF